MSNQIFLPPSLTSSEVVDVGDTCYRRIGDSDQAVTVSSIDEEYSDCEICPNLPSCDACGNETISKPDAIFAGFVSPCAGGNGTSSFYGRTMTSWGCTLSWSGSSCEMSLKFMKEVHTFSYSTLSGTITIDANPGDVVIDVNYNAVIIAAKKTTGFACADNIISGTDTVPLMYPNYDNCPAGNITVTIPLP